MPQRIICPRCFADLTATADLKFCPRCGLPNVLSAAADDVPLELAVNARRYRVGQRLAIGSIATIYRCEIPAAANQRQAIIKVARDAVNNASIEHEARVLRHLHNNSAATVPSAFLPTVIESFDYRSDAPESPRRANILALHPDIHSIDELYTLEEVRAAYPAGIDARDMAWMWRRLLTVLDFVHSAGVSHGAVYPMHMLIEPTEHKLLLIDWCGALMIGYRLSAPPTLLAGGYSAWARVEGVPLPLSPAGDIALGARCMIFLLGGDGAVESLPPSVDPAIARYLQRCARLPERAPVSAATLLKEFDRLIEVLWGPRRFRPLTMPPKTTG